MKTYCVGCDQPIVQQMNKDSYATYQMVWTSVETGDWVCQGMGEQEHSPDNTPLDKQALKATLMNYYCELELKLEFREFDDETIVAELSRILRLIEEMEASG